MKKIILTSVLFMLITVLPAFALTYEFSDSKIVPVSAVMDLTISGNSIHVALNNTSPVKNQGSNNIPAIIGFGFGLTNYDSSLFPITWTMKAIDTSGNPVVIGQSGPAGEWSRSSYVNNEIFMLTSRYPISGLYNPLADISSAALPAYFTTAYLDMIFEAIPVLDEAANPWIKVIAPGYNFYYVEGKSIPTPEPGTLLLLGIGLIGIGIVLRELF